jgi:signal peptidase I
VGYARSGTVEIQGGVPYVNGVALDESYLGRPSTRDYEVVTVPEDAYYLLGDNRSYSPDSRMWRSHCLPRHVIEGKVVAVHEPGELSETPPVSSAIWL